jgi:hypothetical protein
VALDDILEASDIIESVAEYAGSEHVHTLVAAMRSGDKGAAREAWGRLYVHRDSLIYSWQVPGVEVDMRQYDALSAALVTWRWIWSEGGTLFWAGFYADKVFAWESKKRHGANGGDVDKGAK